MLVSPMPNYIIVWGFVSGGIARGIIVGLAVTLVATFFTDIQFHNLPLLVLVTLLTCILFALAGLINGIFANAHPVATVRSAFLQIIARGAALFDFIE